MRQPLAQQCDCFALSGGEGEDAGERVKAQGNDALKQGKYSSALAEFDAVLTIAPDYATAQEGRKAARAGLG